jgi:hypothetical protein
MSTSKVFKEGIDAVVTDKRLKDHVKSIHKKQQYDQRAEHQHKSMLAAQAGRELADKARSSLEREKQAGYVVRK